MPIPEYRRILDALARQAADLRNGKGQPVPTLNILGGESDDDVDSDDDDSKRAGNGTDESTIVAALDHMHKLPIAPTFRLPNKADIPAPTKTKAKLQERRSRSNSTATSTSGSVDSGFESEVSDTSVR